MAASPGCADAGQGGRMCSPVCCKRLLDLPVGLSPLSSWLCLQVKPDLAGDKCGLDWRCICFLLSASRCYMQNAELLATLPESLEQLKLTLQSPAEGQHDSKLNIRGAPAWLYTWRTYIVGIDLPLRVPATAGLARSAWSTCNICSVHPLSSIRARLRGELPYRPSGPS